MNLQWEKGERIMYQFPKDLYADVRIEENYNLWLGVKNGDLDSDGSTKEAGAFIRVFDGTMWYTGTTNKLDEIQKELDNLATLATPNPDILNQYHQSKNQFGIRFPLKVESASNTQKSALLLFSMLP